MKTATNIKEYRAQKKYGKIIEDINNIQKVLSLTQRGLLQFKTYIPVMELISVIETNRTILETHKRNCELEIQKAREEGRGNG